MTEGPARPAFRARSFGFWIAMGLIAIGGYLLVNGRLVRGPIVIVAGILAGLLFRRPTRKHLAFAALTVTLATLMPVALVAGLDLFLHRRFAATGGYNIHGYRGPVLGRKPRGERRIAVLGGSTAFGYGVRSEEAYPPQLERKLNELETGTQRGPVRVVNLGWNGEGAYSFRFTLEDYDYLEPDLVLLDSGYNDLSRNQTVFRRQSPIFRRTGYLPILPIVSAGWLRLANLERPADNAGRVVFRPDLADRSATQAADLARGITLALEREMRRLSSSEPAQVHATASGVDCGRWTDYCRSLSEAVRFALDRGRHVVVVTEPYLGGGGASATGQFDQQHAVRAMLTERFTGEIRVHYLNLGTAVDLTDQALCYDGMHLTPEGNARLAARMAIGVQAILEDMAQTEDGAAKQFTLVPSPLDITKRPVSEPVARGRYETVRDRAMKAALDGYADKNSSDELADVWLRLGDMPEARKALEAQIAGGLDDSWTHRALYLIAASTGDRALLDRQVAWAEGHSDRFMMLSAQADVAAASGRFARSRELRAMAVDDARQRGRSDEAGAIFGRQAIAEYLAGDPARASENARFAVAHSAQGPAMWSASLISALLGRPVEAVTRSAVFKNESPPNILIERLWIPILQAAIELGRGNPQKAVDVLGSTVVYERGTYWPRYLRGLAHLKMGHGFQASLEFSRILTQPVVGPTDIVYVVAERQLAHASALGGGAVSLGPLYGKFFESWKNADPDLPLVREVREEYRDLRRSISLPPLPEGLWRTP